MIDQMISVISALPGGKIILTIIFFALFGFTLSVAYKIIFSLLKKATEKTISGLDDKLLECIRSPVRAFIITFSLFFALTLTYPDISLGKIGLPNVYMVVLIFIAAFALNRLISTILLWYKIEIAPKSETKINDEVLAIIDKILPIAIYGLALMMALSNLGIEITPLLAGLGIASLAVALALQDSFGNFFAGVNVSVDKSFKKDDFISTDFGVEGVVHEVGWRTTKIISPQGNYIIIPNSKLAQSVITNYCYPDKTIIQAGSIGVSYNSDVDHVSNVIKDVMKKTTANNDNFVKNFEPPVFFDSFGDFSLNFKYAYKVKDYRARGVAANEINRAIFLAFKKEKIDIPYPTRTVYNFQK
ncbi:MAG: mechanosensitive ion channel family protein [Candidatus Micrarchaeota archaeon]